MGSNRFRGRRRPTLKARAGQAITLNAMFAPRTPAPVVARAMKRLPHAQARILALRFSDGRRPTEICELEEITLKQYETRLAKAIRGLRHELQAA